MFCILAARAARVLLTAVVLCAIASHPTFAAIPLTCEQVRKYVSAYGAARCLDWARGKGWTPAQIAEARRCLR